MKKTSTVLLAATLGAAMVHSCHSTTHSTPQTDTTQTMDAVRPDSAKQSVSDTSFANKAAIGGMAEVALGKMAAEVGASKAIKDFGKMMVMDHGKANDELKGITQKKNISLPAGLDAEHKAKSDSLSKLAGSAFDKAYVAAMIEGHQKTLALMKAEASQGQDADLKAFAAKTSPVVEHHLMVIQNIQKGLK